MAFRTSGTISRRERAPSGATNIGQVKAAVAAAELAAAPPPPPRVVLSPRPPPPRAAAESKVPQADSPRKVRRAVRTDATSYGLQITVHRDYGFDVAVPKLYHAPFATAFDEVMDRDVAVAEKEMGELETRTRTALLQGRRAAAHEETKAFEELLDRTYVRSLAARTGKVPKRLPDTSTRTKPFDVRVEARKDPSMAHAAVPRYATRTELLEAKKKERTFPFDASYDLNNDGAVDATELVLARIMNQYQDGSLTEEELRAVAQEKLKDFVFGLDSAGGAQQRIVQTDGRIFQSFGEGAGPVDAAFKGQAAAVNALIGRAAKAHAAAYGARKGADDAAAALLADAAVAAVAAAAASRSPGGAGASEAKDARDGAAAAAAAAPPPSSLSEGKAADGGASLRRLESPRRALPQSDGAAAATASGAAPPPRGGGGGATTPRALFAAPRVNVAEGKTMLEVITERGAARSPRLTDGGRRVMSGHARTVDHVTAVLGF